LAFGVLEILEREGDSRRRREGSCRRRQYLLPCLVMVASQWAALVCQAARARWEREEVEVDMVDGGYRRGGG
jgi:hypothetical protein